MEEPIVFSARKEREQRARQSRSNSTPAPISEADHPVERKTSKMEKLASNHLARQA